MYGYVCMDTYVWILQEAMTASIEHLTGEERDALIAQKKDLEDQIAAIRARPNEVNTHTRHAIVRGDV